MWVKKKHIYEQEGDGTLLVRGGNILWWGYNNKSLSSPRRRRPPPQYWLFVTFNTYNQ